MSDSGRPFSTLSLRPFLFAGPKDLELIQGEYLRRSRLYHPDRFPQDDPKAQEEAESKSSALNADFAKVKDFWKRVEAVLSSSKDNAVPKARGGPPPDLAQEYFEMQENLESASSDKTLFKATFSEFARKVESRLKDAETRVQNFSERYPFQGFEGPNLESTPPWTQKDLEELRALVESVRYLRSFLRDIESRI